MSILVENELGWVIDPHRATSQIYTNCTRLYDPVNTQKSFKLKAELFDIHCPFMMDSHFEKWRQEASGVAVQKKRKRPKLPNEEDCAVMKLHQRLESAYTSLLATARSHGHLKESSSIPTTNNVPAREAAAIEGPGEELCELADRLAMRDYSWSMPAGISELGSIKMQGLFHRRMMHTGRNSLVMEVDGSHYLIPSSCAFIMSTFDQLLDNIDTLKESSGYDLIVIDPPWQNKSVKRKKSYCSLDERRLMEIPLEKLATPGCLVVVWVTNSPRLQEFVRGELLPHWGVKSIQEWHWIKTTRSGMLVCELTSTKKKPYETLLLGRVKFSCPSEIPNVCSQRADNSDRCASPASESIDVNPEAVDSELPQKTALQSLSNMSAQCEEQQVSQDQKQNVPDSSLHGNEFTKKDVHPIPDGQVLMSIPCSLHSKKPPLEDVLNKYLPPQPKCLEMFARNLWPGWTSWGQEVLKHQHLDFYEENT